MMEQQQKLAQKQELQYALLALIDKIQPMDRSGMLAENIFSYELGLDSLAKMELAGAIQKSFGVHLDDDELAATNTVNELATTIERKQKQHKPHKPHFSSKSKVPGAPVSFQKSFLTQLIRNSFYRVFGRLVKGHFDIEVQGKEHIPTDRPFIIAANHSSHLDNPSLMIAAGLAFDNYVLLAAKDYFFERRSLKLFLLKFLFNLAPFDRQSEPSAMQENINWCKVCVDEHKNLIIFPESTRSVNGEMQPFKGGCSLLAYELNLPIVPAYIKGAYDSLPKGKSWPKKGHITVSFGQPLLMDNYQGTTSEIKYKIYRKITQDLEHQIKQLGNLPIKLQ